MGVKITPVRLGLMVERRKSGHEAIDNFDGVVIASDEAGYGSLAGPLTVCAVAAPAGWEDLRVTDSKKLGSAERRALFDELILDPRFIVNAVVVSPEVIDREGVYHCLLAAHGLVHQNVAKLLCEKHKHEFKFISVIDGKMPIHRMGLVGNQRVYCLPKADSLVPECGLASIIAKVLHDLKMEDLDRLYPGYHFSQNSGYGGKDDSPHHKALHVLGPCPAHRKSYGPIAQLIAKQSSDSQPSMDDLIAQLGE